MSEEEEYSPRPKRSRSGRAKEAQLSGFRAWTSAALGALILISAGFLLGVALGVVSEEPEMVASHLIGQSEEVVWGDDAPGEVSAPPSASPVQPLAQYVEEPSSASVPSREVVQEVAQEPEPRAPQPQASVPAVSAPPALSTGWAVQVGAFSSSNSADELAESLQAKGFAAYLKPSAGPTDGRWRVRVGPLATRDEASRLARRLQQEESLSTWVLSEGGG
jgi:cell division septation protein DedD